MKLFRWLLFFTAVLGSRCMAGSLVDGSLPNPRVPAVRASGSPVIDGDITDTVWSEAPVITGFTRETHRPTWDTEVRVLYDTDRIYVAFSNYDPQPDQIQAQQRKRNGGLHNDDNVSVGIDPRYDRQSAYWFTVNPLGTQEEEIPGGSASKVEWRGDWKAAARVTKNGWTAEMAIPFDILRYPRGQDTFGLLFSRGVSRLREWTNWPPNTHSGQMENAAMWTGIETPRVRRRPMIMPYVLGASGTIESNSGLDIKYTSEKDTTTLLTIRPDFATIENTVQTVDFSYNEQWVDDRRPFFTEGGDYFDSRFGFYSPAIGEVDAGLKSFGKTGDLRFAALATTRSDQERSALANFRWDPSTRLGFWGGFVNLHRDMPDDQVDNAVMQLGGRYWRPLPFGGMGFSTEYYGSRTRGEGGEGHVFRVNADRWGGDSALGWNFRYNEMSPGYNARLAFLPEVSYRSAGGGLGRRWRVDKGRVRRVGVDGGFDWTEHWGGGLYHRGMGGNAFVDFRNDTRIRVVLDVYSRQEADGDPNDDWRPRRFDDQVGTIDLDWRTSDIYGNGSFLTRFGRVAGGPYAFYNLRQGTRLNDRLSANAVLSVLDLDGAEYREKTNRALLSVLYEMSPERSLAARLIIGRRKSDSWNTGTNTFDHENVRLRNAFMAYRQEVRRGADIFVLLGDPNTDGIRTQVAVKYVTAH